MRCSFIHFLCPLIPEPRVCLSQSQQGRQIDKPFTLMHIYRQFRKQIPIVCFPYCTHTITWRCGKRTETHQRRRDWSATDSWELTTRRAVATSQRGPASSLNKQRVCPLDGFCVLHGHMAALRAADLFASSLWHRLAEEDDNNDNTKCAQCDSGGEWNLKCCFKI